MGMPIDSEIMDGFWHSRCLNDRIKVADIMRLFAGGATTPLVVKIWTKQPWVKIEYLCDFDRDFSLFRGQIWLWLSYNFFALWFQDSTQKISSHFDQKWRRDSNFSRILIWFDRPLLAQGQKLPIGQKWNPHSWNWQLKYISLDWCTYS